MKILKKESCGIQEVFNTNMENNSNYITENGAVNHNCVIDSQYRGELVVHLFNLSDKEVRFDAGDKIVQGVVLPVWGGLPTLVDEIHMDTERGTGGFGSSGK